MSIILSEAYVAIYLIMQFKYVWYVNINFFIWDESVASLCVVTTVLRTLDVLSRKQCYNLEFRIEGSYNKVIKFIVDWCSFNASKLLSKWRENFEVTRI